MQNRKPGEELEVNHGITLTLARERFGIHWLEDHALHDVRNNYDHREHKDLVKQQMVHSLETSILTMDEDEFAFECPENWWQAFRQRWFPNRWLNKHPVKMTYIRERRYGKVFLSVFPDRTTEHQGSHMRFQHHEMYPLGSGVTRESLPSR
jgi:hypothetical protein